jgi:hypothetical protein
MRLQDRLTPAPFLPATDTGGRYSKDNAQGSMHIHAQEGDKKPRRRIVGEKPVGLFSAGKHNGFRLACMKISDFFPLPGFLLLMGG